MKSTVEKLEASRVKISSEVTYDELKPAVDGAAKKLSQQVNIPGFRRGKVPTRVLESHIGRPAIIEQAVNDSLDRYYQQALAEHELTPLGQPEVEITEWPNVEGTPGGTLKFDISVDVKPEVTLPDFSDITLTVDRPEVTDADVEERLTDLRTRFATLKSVNRKIKKDDFVNIDMEASINGEQIDSVSGISYQLGSGQLLEGIDKALTGKKEGETAEFVSKLAGGEHEGEEADVKVTIHSVKVQELPEADDDFAQLASEFDTIDELREDVRKETEKDKLADVVYQGRDLLLEKLRDEVEIEIPTRVIDAEIKRHLESEGKEADDKHGEEIRKETEDSFRNQMILDAIAADRKVGIEQDELFQFMVQQAQMYGMDPNQFIQAAAQTNQIPAFAGELTRNKAVISSLRDVTIVDNDGKEIDIKSIINDELGEEAPAEDEKKPAKKAPAKKAPAKKPAAKKPAAKKAPAKTAAKKDDEAEAPKKTTTRKTAAKKAEAEGEEKAPAKKPAAKKPAAKKAPAKKPVAKKADEE